LAVVAGPALASPALLPAAQPTAIAGAEAAAGAAAAARSRSAAGAASRSAAAGGDAAADGGAASTSTSTGDTIGAALGQAPGAATGPCVGEVRLGFGALQFTHTLPGACAAAIAERAVTATDPATRAAAIAVMNRFAAAYFGDAGTAAHFAAEEAPR
jgi:hypothetical protein